MGRLFLHPLFTGICFFVVYSLCLMLSSLCLLMKHRSAVNPTAISCGLLTNHRWMTCPHRIQTTIACVSSFCPCGTCVFGHADSRGLTASWPETRPLLRKVRIVPPKTPSSFDVGRSFYRQCRLCHRPQSTSTTPLTLNSPSLQSRSLFRPPPAPLLASQCRGLWPCRNACAHVSNKSNSTTFLVLCHFRLKIYIYILKLTKQRMFALAELSTLFPTAHLWF